MSVTEKEIIVNVIKSKFHKIYYKDIKPIMAEYEKKREFEWLKISLIEMVLVTVFVACVGCLYKGIVPECVNALIIVFMFLLPFGIFGLPFYMNSEFSKLLKTDCMDKIVKAFGNMTWEKNGFAISDSSLQKSELFSSFNRRSNDDAFIGKYKDVSFQISETHMWYESGSGKNKSIREVFKGVIINFGANKTINNKTIVATKADKNIKGRQGSVWFVLIMLVAGIIIKDLEICLWGVLGVIIYGVVVLREKFSKNKEVLNEIKLEDPVFNKKYKAYSSDEIEGRYLITPSFMERFNNLQTAFTSRGAKCSFYANYIMFAISTNKNLFEIGNLFTPLNNPKQLEKFFSELLSILSLVDYFKLDEKTGL